MTDKRIFATGTAIVIALIAVAFGLHTKTLSIAGVSATIVAGIIVIVAVLTTRRAMHCIGQDEQLQVQHFMGTKVHNGPGVVLLNPFGYRSCRVLKVDTLGLMDYAKIKDNISGMERVARGPQLLFLGANEVVTRKGDVVSLSCTEYIIVEDKVTGDKALVKGPQVWTPGPHDIASSKQTALALQEDEYLRLKDTLSGHRWVQRGKALVFLEPTWKIDGAKPSVSKAYVLKVNEYVRFLNVTSGQIKVHRGESIVFPGPDDEVLDGGIKKAIEIDEEHAALVRDQNSGQLQLVTEKQLFVPGPNEKLEEVRELIKLTDSEAMILKDKQGIFKYYYGDEKKRSADQPRSFFVPPYTEVVKTFWSRGARRDKRDLLVDRFSFRPHLMRIEFKCRTADHVELVVEGVVAWDLVDLPTMFCKTGDPPGDICYHVRSQFVREVAQVTLKMFMDGVHEIAKKVIEDSSFFAARGVSVTALEVGRYYCADKSTSEILEQIIQETTNRMNRLSQAESENEVNIFRTHGQTEQIKLNGDLLKIQHEQTLAEACIAGRAEADRVASFLKTLEPEVPLLEERVQMWQVLRKTDALSVVSKGEANLYFTPNDVDLSIETKAPKAHNTDHAT